MDLLVLNVHSAIDVITNSSTELFIAGKDQSVEMVKGILERIITGYNTMVGGNHTYEDFFAEPYVATKKNMKKHGIDLWLEEEYYPHMKDQIVPGKTVLVPTESDNTCPYELWEIIDQALGGTHIHLG